MSADTLETYRHSGKFKATGLLLPLGTAAVAAVPLGLAYSYLIRWIPFVYVNFFATLGYGFAFGWLTTYLLKAGHVRNTALAALCGLIVGCIALYGEWSGHLHVIFDDSPWFFRPDQVARGVAYLYEHGSWSFHRTTVSGIPLALVWLVEAGIIVGLATAMPFATIGSTPFCERTLCWLDEEKQINTLESFTDDAQLAALKAGDIMPITQAKPKVDGAAVYTRLLLKRSEKCQIFCTLRVQEITVDIDKEGKVNEKAEDLTGDLIIPASMFDLIAQFEHFTPVPPAAAVMPKLPAGM